MSRLFKTSVPRSLDPRWLRPELAAPWWEIILIGGIFIGPFAWRSTVAALAGSSGRYLELLASDRRLLFTGAVESAMLAVLFGYLAWRGWKTADWKVRPSWLDSLAGFGLFLCTEAANAVTVFGVYLLLFVFQAHYASFPGLLAANIPHLKFHSLDVGWPVIFSTMILNAFFEELICMGYIFNQLAARYGPLVALLCTVLLRMSCHTYQGPVHVLGIGALFLIYGIWYWRTRNLWPLIFAHATLDLFSMGLMKIIFGR